tara:strand:+ start:28 stop:597 length:570 start_codon:yes stop_codon:yes gene_type:complete
MKYLKSKKGSLENSILGVWKEAATKVKEGSKEEYQKFFNSALKKFKIDSPADLKSDAEKKKFFNYVDKNYTGEKDEEVVKQIESLRPSKMKAENYEVGTKERRNHTLETTPGQSPKEFEQQVEVMHKKKNSMREALAKMWGIKEDKNPFDKKVDKKEQKKYNKGKSEGKTLTGKKETQVEIEPKMEKKK